MSEPGAEWRTLSWDETSGARFEHSSDAEPRIFDELVIDDWLHIEQMTRRRWWMRIGDLVVWVKVDKDGSVRLTSYRDE